MVPRESGHLRIALQAPVLPLALTLLMAFAAFSVAFPQEQAGPMTLGEFLVRVATALQLPAPAGGFTPPTAATSLQGRGIVTEADPAGSLREADAVKVLAALGYRVVTETPSRTVDAARAELLIRTFIVPAAGPPATD